MADHTASLIALREHSGSFAKAWEDRLMENTSCYPPLPFSSHFHGLWSSRAVILGLIYIALLQPSFRRMLGLGREVEAELATKRVLLTDPFGYSSEISFTSYFTGPLYSPGAAACGRKDRRRGRAVQEAGLAH